MKKITFILISLGLFFTTMLNFVYAINGSEESIKNIKQADDITKNNDTKGESMPSIVYNIHMQDYGWLGNDNNESINRVIDESKRLEAIQISLNDNIYNGSIEYSAHVEGYGWLDYVSNGEISGTTGESRRLEAVKIKLNGEISNYYDVIYRVYCQNIGWLDWTSNGKVAGTVGGSYKLEAIQIKLSSKNDEKLEKTNKSSLTFSYKSGFKVC